MIDFFSLFKSFLNFILGAFYYFWWIPVLFFLALTFKTKREKKWVENQEYKLLLIQVPKENEKGPVAAEMMFAALHGIFKPTSERIKEGSLQEHISFEIASIDKKIRFYCWLPAHLQDFVEGQIYAQYPDAEIKEVDDYTKYFDKINGKKVVVGELALTKSDFFPIRTFPNFDVDPLSGLTSVLSKMESSDEQLAIQILIRPADPSWTEKAFSYVKAVRSGEVYQDSVSILEKIAKFFRDLVWNILVTLLNIKVDESGGKKEVKLPPNEEAKLKSVEVKASKLPFEAGIRILCYGENEKGIRLKIQSIVGAFKQFTSYNSFALAREMSGEEALQVYKSRFFGSKGFVLNIEELASIFHLPNVSVEVPNILWTGFKKAEPPANLPIPDKTNKEEICILGKTNYRNIKQIFGIKTDDRRRHMYIIGRTGMGKTTLLENMVVSDINNGKGVAVIDPHGDFYNKLLDLIPSWRINDVVLFDPSDREWPVAFNPLEQVSPDQRQLIVSGLISIFQKIWSYTWGPRLEHILRNTLAALLEYPDSTLLDVNRMFVDKNFRKKVIKKITDIEVKRFWTQEFPGYEQNEKFKTEAIAPIQNKVGQFLSSPTIRNIIGQPHSAINIRKIMDEGKILLVNLSQGAIGEDNSALLGAMLITKIQLAAMSRVDLPEEERRDFYLYVDEFQNFTTPTFAKILSEARKYRLNLILTNQYLAQMIDVVRDAIFGNVGTLIAFKVGAPDASFLAKEFAPIFSDNDLINLDKYNIYLKMSIDGVTCRPFSAQTLPPVSDFQGNKDKIIKLSREQYAQSRNFVERKIAERLRVDTGEIILTDIDELEKKVEAKIQKEITKENLVSEEKIPLENILEETFLQVINQNKDFRNSLVKNEYTINNESFQERKVDTDKNESLISKKIQTRQEIKPGQIIKFD